MALDRLTALARTFNEKLYNRIYDAADYDDRTGPLIA